RDSSPTARVVKHRGPIMNSLHAIQSHYWAVRDYLSPVLRESKFKEHGRITPEEFVAAGDFLAYKFP
ncbi:E2-like enzyme, partial [Ceratobasidium sp. 392]